MPSKKSVTVRILDQKFLINTDAPPERVKKIADFVNRNLEQAMAKSKGANPFNAAVLAALNITEQYFDALERQSALKTSVAEKSRKILGLLNNAGDSN